MPRVIKTQCTTCGTKHTIGHPCPKCNNHHVKRRTAKRKTARWRGDLQAKGVI